MKYQNAVSRSTRNYLQSIAPQGRRRVVSSIVKGEFIDGKKTVRESYGLKDNV